MGRVGTHHFERSEGQQGGAALAAGPAVPVGVLSPLQDELLSNEALALIAHPANRKPGTRQGDVSGIDRTQAGDNIELHLMFPVE